MTLHRGKIVEKRLHIYSAETGTSLLQIAKNAGYEQSTMYRHFQKPDLKTHVILKYARAIKYDFVEDIPDMKEFVNAGTSLDENGISLERCRKERDQWKDKYIQLLEKHNQMLEDNMLGKPE